MPPTVRISVEPAKAQQAGARVVLEMLDQASGRFVAIKGANAVLPASLDIKPPLDDPEQPGQPLTAERVAELAQQSPVAPAVGQYLQRLLLGGRLGAAWAALRQQPMQLQLRLGADARLHALPWERLFDERGDYLALTAGSPLARWMDPPAPLAPARADDWPIRMLIVHGAAPGHAAGGAARVAADEEMQALERLLGSRELRQDVEYDVLEHPSRQQIVEACRTVRPHVLHVIAHAQAAGAGAELLLWQPPQPAQPGQAAQPAVDDPWRAADLRLQLQGIAPRLVFLNACRSSIGAQAAAAPLPLASLTQAFLQAGSAAALGMQGEVAGDLAQEFAETFYRRLIEDEGADIDAAVLAARLAMAGKRLGASVTDDADWAFPVLTRCVAADAVLPRAPQRLVAPAVDRFVSRLPQRREAHEAVRCCATSAIGLSDHLAVIVGGPGSGKSYLARWAAQACQRAGMRVADVRFSPQDKVDWLDALRWVRDGQRRVGGAPTVPAADWPLKPAAFRLFNWALNRRLEGMPTFDPPADDGAPIADLGCALSAAKRQPEELEGDTFAAFHDALGKAGVDAGPGASLLIKLDDLAGIDHRSLVGPLTELLIKPVATGRLPLVRLLLVMEHEQWAELQPRLPLRPRVVTVPYFQQGDFERVARQLCHQWSARLYAMQEVRDSLPLALPARQEPSEWGIDVLNFLSALLPLVARRQGVLV